MEAMPVNFAKQALILSLGNALTRGLGFVLRLLLGRWMGAQALGVMEMANSVGMLALTPVTAGIPSAVSRLTAKETPDGQERILASGLRLVRQMALWLMPALLLLSPALSWLLGDARTLPAILLTAPDILLLGLCSVYCGYCYGRENTLLPALAECAEQGTRFVLSVALVLALRHLGTGVTAALPGAAEALAAQVVVMIFRRALPHGHHQPDARVQRQIFRLAAPTTLSRLCLAGMRALEAVLLPVCLRRSGLSAGAATAQFGLFTGMAMPMMLMPGVVTSALCMITTPAISRSEGNLHALRCTMRRMLLPALGIGVASALLLFFWADLFSLHLYHTPALAPLLRFMCPATLLFALHQVQIGMITGLGLQRKALTGTILSSVVSLLVTAALACQPHFRLFGAALGTMAGQAISVLWDAAILQRAKHE